MPDKLIPGKKRTMAYKKGPYKMKGWSPFNKNEEEEVTHTHGGEEITKEQFEEIIKGLQSGEIKPSEKELKRIRKRKT